MRLSWLSRTGDPVVNPSGINSFYMASQATVEELEIQAGRVKHSTADNNGLRSGRQSRPQGRHWRLHCQHLARVG